MESGGLLLLLDGLNEVQNRELQSQLVDEINRLTAPEAATARSRWIVSGRVHDYNQTHYPLVHLGRRRWEMQSLTADVIFRFLADVLGEAAGKNVYDRMGPQMREVCSNPLLLTRVTCGK